MLAPLDAGHSRVPGSMRILPGCVPHWEENGEGQGSFSLSLDGRAPGIRAPWASGNLRSSPTFVHSHPRVRHPDIPGKSLHCSLFHHGAGCGPAVPRRPDVPISPSFFPR